MAGATRRRTALLWAAGLGIAGATPGLSTHAMAQEPAPPAAEAPADAAQAGGQPLYTEAQAQRGRNVYMQRCADCHGANLDDGEFGGPPLRGSYFDRSWRDQPADSLFHFMSGLMPPDRPNSLGDQAYTDIMAFILQHNGFPAGEQELPADPEALADIILSE